MTGVHVYWVLGIPPSLGVYTVLEVFGCVGILFDVLSV